MLLQAVDARMTRAALAFRYLVEMSFSQARTGGGVQMRNMSRVNKYHIRKVHHHRGKD